MPLRMASAATAARAFRQLCREGKHTGQTSGLAGAALSRCAQANVVILRHEDAEDFENFCRLNPKPCPLLEMTEVGSPFFTKMGKDIDVTRDVPKYSIFQDGNVVDEAHSVESYWDNDMVGFLLGCSFSFESALVDAGLPVRHIEQGSNVPMYKTNIQCKKSGKFEGPMVVSMRPFLPSDVETVIAITEQYPRVHGAPIHVGSPEEIGVDVSSPPDWGDAVEIRDGEVPVFWACGVTPQAALVQARLPLAITHAPGHMLILDVENEGLTGNLMEN